ncbi:hypothetical protein J6590_025323 [Homalodisca vitripennis]|nr:hypothetical protein J6590_025323 [Homalodisca vitripennis]
MRVPRSRKGGRLITMVAMTTVSQHIDCTRLYCRPQYLGRLRNSSSGDQMIYHNSKRVSRTRKGGSLITMVAMTTVSQHMDCTRLYCCLQYLGRPRNSSSSDQMIYHNSKSVPQSRASKEFKFQYQMIYHNSKCCTTYKEM